RAMENASIAAANVLKEKTRAACRTQNGWGWLMAAPSAGCLQPQRMHARQFANLRLARRLDRTDAMGLQDEYKGDEVQHVACESGETHDVLHVRLPKSLLQP